MLQFDECRKYIENEFEEARFDESTGQSVEDLIEYLKTVQQSETKESRRIVCANAYAYLLEHVQLEINEHTPFAVKINIGVDYSSFASSDIFALHVYEPQRGKLLREKFAKEHEKMQTDKVSCGTWTDFWHTVPNWDHLLKLGFVGILESTEKSKQKLLSTGDSNEAQIDFLDSVMICYKAILGLLERIYRYSLHFNVPEFSECILHLTQRPPQTLYEVMQFSVLFLYFEEIGCERARTLGDIDRLYLPYYEADLANGVAKEALDELFKFFFIHFTATKRFAEQPFTLGGGDKDGNDRASALTLRILELYNEIKIFDPKIHLRYHENLDQDVLKKALAMIRDGHNSICIINDAAVFAGYERLGIPKEDAQGYVVLGCYEPIIMGLEEGEIGVAWLNAVKFVEFAINGGKDLTTQRQCGPQTKTAFDSFDEFLEVFFKQLDYCIDENVDFAERQGEYSTHVNPSPIYSSTFPECIEKGMDVHEYPLKYNNMGIKLFGLATVVDSLAAIKKFVFDRKEISFEEMKNALTVNWNGYEELRQKAWRDVDKYGNNRALPDDIMVRITEHLKNKYCGMPLKRGGRLRLGLDSINNCLYMGKITSATPDGRLAGAPLSKNLCATEGKDVQGITAYMQTVLKIDSSGFLNGAPLDFILHPSSVGSEKGLQAFLSLVKAFFANGGFALQGNIFHREMLVEAKAHPEKYSTLQVRVCGWNEYFVKLSHSMQNMFIAQCEALNR